MDHDDSFFRNQKAISERLKWLDHKKDGVIYKIRSPMHNIVIQKEGTKISLLFIDDKGEDNGPMAEIDLADPLCLTRGYYRLLPLSLLWQPNPKRIYQIGFGGGRIAMFLHHHFPDVIIESTEIDPEVPELAKKYFGVLEDQRLKVALKDGRDYLKGRSSAMLFEIIIVDAFRGTGYIPYHLSTTNFYELCKLHLAPSGVVAINLLENDPLYRRRVNTIAASFRSTYLAVYDGGKVAFGTDNPLLDAVSILRQSENLEKSLDLSFPLHPGALYLKSISEQNEYLAQFGDSKEILTDRNFPCELDEYSAGRDIFRRVRANDPCPCGSGKKFKKCHGLKHAQKTVLVK